MKKQTIVHIRIDAVTRKKLKLAAAKRGISLIELVRELAKEV
jgi:predicted HicB family RNase H-like nuclease